MNYGGGQTVSESGELEALRWLDESAQAGPFVLFDVGANDGQYLDSALKVLRATEVRAYSFEPQPACFDTLHTRFNGARRVHLYQLALGKEPGSASLYFDATGDTTATLHHVADGGGKQSETVKIGTLDGFCEAERIDRIDLLKIDTEGYEMDVLLGARKMIQSGVVAAIQFEFGDAYVHTPYHFADFWELLTPQFIFFRILRNKLERITDYSTDLEIYKTANFLCVRREAPLHHSDR